MIIQGEDISIGGITAIMMYNGLLSAPVNNIISMCIDLFKVNVSLERVNKIFTTPIDESYLNINNEIEINDIITVRGKGKFIFDGVEKETRSGRLLINMRKYK